MTAHVRQLLGRLGDSFWLLPAAMVLAGIGLAVALVALDRSGMVPVALVDEAWLYNGGATGARTLLGAIASSTIAVAGTVFSITIAALSLAAGQMGPRLLRNFTRDRGNQLTLGAFLGTFSYALMVLRSVRTQDEGDFIPHAAMSAGMLLAFACVALLVYFVGHMAGRINVDTVIDLVSADLREATRRLTATEPQADTPPPAYWRDAVPLADHRRGYVQQLDHDGLADWAAAHGTAIRLLVGPGDFVFPGAPVAVLTVPVDGAVEAIRAAMALGPRRAVETDLAFAMRQLVEVAVRALSPGINDPHTAISAIDRLGAALCDLAPLRLPSGVTLRHGRPVLVVPMVDYDALVGAMFHMIRQSAARQPAVLIRLLHVLGWVAACELAPDRQSVLRRHAGLVLEDGEREIRNPADLEDLRRRHAIFVTTLERGPLASLVAAG
jgi:uncharacterized membrane protein